MSLSLRRPLVLLVALVAAFLGTNLGAAANAVQLYGASGSYGSITPYQVRGTDVNTCASVGTCYQRQVQIPGATIGKSPSATAAQNITANYRIYRWNGSSWGLYKSATHSYSMGYNSSVRLPGVNFSTTNGYYTVQMTFTWTTSSTGMQLGQRSVNYNGYDYGCYNAPLGCSTNQGWVYLG